MSVEVRHVDKENAHLLAGKVMMLTGVKLTGDAVAQAFYEVMATHRHQAEEAMRERAAMVAENSASICPPGQGRIAARIAAAIRSIDTRGE